MNGQLAFSFDEPEARKRCSKCRITKPLSEFSRRGDGRRGECKACVQTRYNAYREQLGPDRRRAQSMWQLYRLPWDDYQDLLAAQLGRCAICAQPFSTNPRLIHVDHDHGCDHPGKGRESCRACVRAILCARCNVFVGWIETGDGQLEGRLGAILRYLGIHGAVILAQIMRDVGYELFRAGEDEREKAKAGESHE